MSASKAVRLAGLLLVAAALGPALAQYGGGETTGGTNGGMSSGTAAGGMMGTTGGATMPAGGTTGPSTGGTTGPAVVTTPSSPGPPASPAVSPVPPLSPSPAPSVAANQTVSPWTVPTGNVPPYADRTASVGTSVTFDWTTTGMVHGLYRIPGPDCPQTFTNTPTLQEIKAPTDSSSATFTFSAPGTYYFACPVDGHCSLGMKSKFTVT